MEIKSHIITLKSKYPFRIAHGTRTETRTFILEIKEDGLTGYGEATPVPYYGVTPEDMQTLLEKHIDIIKNSEWEHPSELWETLKPHIGENPFLHCAIDIAAHDLWAQKTNQPLYEKLGLDKNNAPFSNYTIGIDEIPEMIKKMKEYDFPIYKIKLGTDHDIEILIALRKETEALFRVDANTAWTPEQTLNFAEKMKALNVEFIEQPLKAEDWQEMEDIYIKSSLPIIADESCFSEFDVEKCIGRFHGINIKLAKCGGITPALRMIKKARENKMKVMMGCMTESSIGISALAHLSPLLDYIDMDGTLLISNDPAEGVYLDKGKPIFSEKSGLGAVLIKK